jgi:hypothetical protein
VTSVGRAVELMVDLQIATRGLRRTLHPPGLLLEHGAQGHPPSYSNTGRRGIPERPSSLAGTASTWWTSVRPASKLAAEPAM